MLKVGTKVRIIGKGLVTKGDVGRIVNVDEKNKGWPYTVNAYHKDRFGPITYQGAYADGEIEEI